MRIAGILLAASLMAAEPPAKLTNAQKAQHSQVALKMALAEGRAMRLQLELTRALEEAKTATEAYRKTLEDLKAAAKADKACSLTADGEWRCESQGR